MEKEQLVDQQGKQVVVLKLKDEEFGIDIYLVREVLKILPITALPDTHKFIEGVINIRGSVIPVIELCKRFGFAEDTRSRESRIIIVESNGEQVGLIVNEVTEVLRISGEEIQPPPSRLAGTHAEFLEGVARCDNRLIILLDIENLLSSQEKLEIENCHKLESNKD